MNPWRGLRGLPRPIWIITSATLLNRAGTMVLPFLVLYLTESLKLSEARAGQILALFGAASLVASPVSGRLCDRYGALTVMRASLAAAGAIMLAFPLAKSFAAAAAATALLSLTGEMFRPANMAILSELAAPEQRKPAFALNRLAVNVGMSVGPVAGGFLAAISFPALFLIDGATSLAAAAVLITALRAPARAAQPTGGARALGRSALGAFADRRLLYFSAAVLPVGLVFFQLQAAMPLYVVHDIGLSKGTLGLVLAVNTVVIVLIEVPLNMATAGWSHRRTLSLGALLVGAGFGATALARGPLSLAATVAVWTFGEMIIFPGSSAYVADLAPPHRRGDYMGAYSMVFGLCLSIGPWLGAAVLERFGGSALWGSSFLLGALSAALFAKLPEPPAAEEIAPKPAE